MKKYYSWKNIEELCDKIIKEYNFEGVKYLYGLPRGGLIPAVILSHKTNIPLLDDKPLDYNGVLIVDDIYDRGNTLKPYLELGYKSIVLCNKLINENVYSAKQENDDWIVFPWETESSSKMDYLEK